MNIDKQALREEFRFMQAHYSDPADRARQVIYIAAEALLDELETKEEQRANWFQMAQKLGEDLDAAEKRNAEQREYYEGVIADGSKRIAELENSETQLINERDAAESALADMYQAATGERPEWNNMFGFSDAVDVVEERLATLEANQSQTTPTGIQLITEAIGAHGYIVGCLLQGRPDLALEESRKWVSAFGQAAEIVSAQDAAGIKVKGE
ncbi:ead/Ea22-like family protein [Salmonella enterica]|nr:ead/Ea22-like family protein [Salmonella enterica]EAO4190437.1 ead/Ea22-like family protein [Salmonella enterica]EIX7380298.1 ead/Ea22-like family protein [Salmonella enterica]HAE9020052.1 ead/Ea22-like family protein [Salmonella enterica subsp. enterica serovar Javiana]